MCSQNRGSLKSLRLAWIALGVVLITSGCEAGISATETPTTIIGTTVFSGIVVRPSNEAIDVVFVPDDGYGDMSDVTARQGFLDDVNDMINNGFWMNQTWSWNFLEVNYWFMTLTGDVQPGTGICPSVTWPDLTDAAFAEVIVLLHTNILRDCASGNRVTSEPTSFRTVVHEASHAAWGLPDEYCCDGGYWSIPPVLYTSSNACNNDPVNAAWRNCQSFTAVNGNTWWRSEDTNCDVMVCGGTVVTEYGPADWVIVEGVLDGLPNSAVVTPNVFAPTEWP